MIGKIKKFNFESLFILNTFALIVTSYFFNNFIFTGVYILFFFISIFTTKNGLKIIKKFNLLQNIRNEGPANHFKKSDTPTMGGFFMIIPFLILLFISPDSNNRLLLSISTLILTYTQIKSGKRFIGSLGWSVTFLSIGLIFGGLLENNSFIQEVSNNSLSIQKIQSIPAMVILWLGVIFL